MSVKARAYNAFLQGQFRESDHELDANDWNILLAEVWAGYTYSFLAGTELSYVIAQKTGGWQPERAEGIRKRTSVTQNKASC